MEPEPMVGTADLVVAAQAKRIKELETFLQDDVRYLAAAYGSAVDIRWASLTLDIDEILARHNKRPEQEHE